MHKLGNLDRSAYTIRNHEQSLIQMVHVFPCAQQEQYVNCMNQVLLWRKHNNNKQSKKYTTHRNIHTNNMQEFEPISLTFLLQLPVYYA